MENKIEKPKIPGHTPVIIVSVILFFLFLYITYKINNYPKVPEGTNTNVGALGDAFNGLTAPFITLLSAFLVYYSFRAQIIANNYQYEANKMLESQWQFDTYLSLFRDIDEQYNKIFVLFNKIPAYSNSVVEKLNGKNAFDAIVTYRYGTGAVQNASNAVVQLYQVVGEFIYLVNIIGDLEFSQKHILIYKVIRYNSANFEGLKMGLETTFKDFPDPAHDLTFKSLGELDKAIERLKKKI